MAVTKEIQTVEILVSTNVGMNAKGQPVTKDIAFKNINLKASNDVLYKQGTVLGSLIKDAKSGIYVRERHLLTEVQP